MWEQMHLTNGLDLLKDVSQLKSKTGWDTYSWETGGDDTKTCPNCLNWSKEYKSKVPCHVCKDTRYVNIKKTPVIKHTRNGGSNKSGFTALPGGVRQYDGIFGGVGSICVFWSSTEGNKHNYQNYNEKIWDAFYFIIKNSDDYPENKVVSKSAGMSIRCIKN